MDREQGGRSPPSAATVPFDDRINQQAKIEDLSRELMQEYLRQVGSDLAEQAAALSLVDLGRQMGVVGGPEEAPFPLNVGLMIFSPDLRQVLGIRHRPTFRENYLQPAMERGLIEYTIPDKPTSRLQRYRLTGQGRRLLTDAKIKD